MAPTDRSVAWSGSPIWAAPSDAEMGDSPTWGDLISAVPAFGLKVACTPNYISAPTATPGGSAMVLSGTNAVMRQDGVIASGTSSVGKEYKPFQNRDLFQMVTEAGDGFGTKIIGAGIYKRSSRAFIQVELPVSIIPGDDAEEELKVYATVVNSFDGNKSMTVSISTVRVACTNMLPMHHLLPGVMSSASIRHTRSGALKVAALAQVFGEFVDHAVEIRQAAENEIARQITIDEFDAIAANVFPIADDASESLTERREAERQGFTNAYYNQDARNLVGSAYGVRQAAGRVDTHDYPNTDTRQLRVWNRSALGEDANSVSARTARALAALESGDLVAA